MNTAQHPAIRFIACFLSASLFFTQIILPEAFAETETSNLVLRSSAYLPPVLKAVHFDPQAPLEISFIIDGADKNEVRQNEANKLVQYFLTSLTIPEKDMWVNLSPNESKRIIVPQFGETTAGRELLGQDQMLKQLAASLTYPESETGKAFWTRVYQKAIELYGTTAIPIDTFQRVWIMPAKAVVYEYNGTAFVTESRLKVLLEDDYLALKNVQRQEQDLDIDRLSLGEAKKVNNFSATVTREVILPEIEKEINEGKNFASLRQVFNAIILATWFKKKLKQHILAKVYVDRKKVRGIEDDSSQTAQRIYEQYMRVLQAGVYNYVRADYDAPSQSIISRQYFSGGFSIGNSEKWLDIRQISKMLIPYKDFLLKIGQKLFFVAVLLRPLGADASPVQASVTNSNLNSDPEEIFSIPSGPSPGSVLAVSARDLKGRDLVEYFIGKFEGSRTADASSPLLVFLEGPVELMSTKEILAKAAAVEDTAVYWIEKGKISMIDSGGNIGEEVSSSALLSQRGLVLVASSASDGKVRYKDAAKVKGKTKLSEEEQLAAYLQQPKQIAAGSGPDKAKGSSSTTGGIDMQVEQTLNVQGKDRGDWGSGTIPDSFLKDMQGMDFKVTEFTPIVNPSLFIPDFVRTNGVVPPQLLLINNQ